MLDSEILKQILISFAGTLLAILSAGIVWLFRSAYEKHKAEVLALARLERTFAINITSLKDNFDFVNSWLEALKNDRPYSFRFQSYFINDKDTYKLSNLNLINQILSLNYKLRRTSLDLDNVYKSYWDVISRINSIQDEKIKINSLQIYHATVRQTLKQIKQNYEPLRNSSVNVVALIRVVARVRFHSLFGYLSLLFRDIFPTINEKAIEAEIAILKKNLEKIEKGRWVGHL